MPLPAIRADDVKIASTVDEDEIRHFDAHSGVWWDEAGVAKWIHSLNPLRVDYTLALIARTIGLAAPGRLDGLRILDVGCGAGVFTEPLARLGATIVGIDPGEALIEVATRHAATSGLAIDYRCTTPEALVTAGEAFHVVIAYDVIEHVADPRLFLDACAKLVDRGGIVVLSTMNRTIPSYLQVILLGEYVLRFLPRGSHRWKRFIKPQEIANALAQCGLATVDLKGLTMNLRTWKLQISGKTNVTYFIALQRMR